ncbi:MAG: hypothetical protein EXR09_02240 [Acetobacteraceae bacterium]|nr:hypothetical protein [Acetobacteraceae bacterium]
MGYVEKALQPEETVTYKTTVHWFLYIPAAAWGVTAFAFMVYWWHGNIGASVLGWLSLASSGMAVLKGLYAWVKRLTTELAVTSRRVIYKTGLLRRHTLEMNLSKVESVGVTQTVLGRVFGYGRIELKGTGASDSTLPMISDPLKFRSHITAG